MDYCLSGAWTFSEEMLIDLLSTGSPGTKFHEFWIKIAQNDKYRQEHGSPENNIHLGPLLLTWFNFNPSMDM